MSILAHVNGRSGQRLFRRIRKRGDDVQPKGGANPFANLVENLCEVQRIAVEPLDRPDGPVRICLVSMPAFSEADFTFEDYDHAKAIPRLVHPEDCRRRVVSLRKGVEIRFLESYKEALTHAVEVMGAHVVCVSELGLPHRMIIPMSGAQQFAASLSSSHGVLIVAGTSHDKRTLYNTGYLYHPGGGGWAFHKTVSATGMGEMISSPAKRRVLTVKTLGLRIAVLICLDIADYATLASVIRVKDKVDVVLVPCYTFKFDKMLDVAKIASKALGGVVAMVNAHVPNAVCHIARFGRDEEAAKAQTLGSGAVLSLFEIDHPAFERERQEAEKARDRYQVEWLFGSGDVPHVLSRPQMGKQREGGRASKRG
ncbi:MAG: hypothetical protein ACXW4P_24165 [Thermoanaerobaculia bacterium]